jgi:hypothetical protein
MHEQCRVSAALDESFHHITHRGHLGVKGGRAGEQEPRQGGRVVLEQIAQLVPPERRACQRAVEVLAITARDNQLRVGTGLQQGTRARFQFGAIGGGDGQVQAKQVMGGALEPGPI